MGVIEMTGRSVLGVRCQVLGEEQTYQGVVVSKMKPPAVIVPR